MSTKNEQYPVTCELNLAEMSDGKEYITYEKRDDHGLGEHFIADQVGKPTESPINGGKNLSHIIFRDEIKRFRERLGIAHLKDGRSMEIFKKGLGIGLNSDEAFLLAVEHVTADHNGSAANHKPISSIRQYFLSDEDIAKIEWSSL